MSKKNTNTYTVIEDRLIEEVGNAFDALVLAFIIRRANYDKSTKPEIQKSYIMKYLGIGNNNRLLYRILNNLEENGWFTTEVISRGSKTTVFTLSDKSRKYLGFAHNCQFVEELEEENTVSELTETVDNQDEQVNNIGISMMESDGYAPEPTQFSYTTTGNNDTEEQTHSNPEEPEQDNPDDLPWNDNDGTGKKNPQPISEIEEIFYGKTISLFPSDDYVDKLKTEQLKNDLDNAFRTCAVKSIAM